MATRLKGIRMDEEDIRLIQRHADIRRLPFSTFVRMVVLKSIEDEKPLPGMDDEQAVAPKPNGERRGYNLSASSGRARALGKKYPDVVSAGKTRNKKAAGMV